MSDSTKLLLTAAKVAGLMLWLGIFYELGIFDFLGYVIAGFMDFLKIVLCF